MADSRDYVSHSDELGNIHISEEVLTTIAAAAAIEVEGVGSLAASSGKDMSDRVGKKSLSKSVRIRMDEADRVEVEVCILMAYGQTIPEVGRAVQEAVKTSIESMTGLEVTCVHVNVSGVSFPEKA